MSVPEELFDEDYLYFYADVLGAERSDGDAELIARLLDLKPGIRVLDVPCGEGRISGRLAARGCDVVGIDATARFVGLARFMIGAQHQGRGYGHAAVRLLVEHAALTEAPLIETSCVPGPGSPADFYRSLGFRDTGRLEHDEEVLRLEL